MKKKLASYLILHVAARYGAPMECATLSYVWREEPIRSARPVEDPLPSILRRLSAGGPGAPAAERKPELTEVVRPVTRRPQRTPPRPWV